MLADNLAPHAKDAFVKAVQAATTAIDLQNLREALASGNMSFVQAAMKLDELGVNINDFVTPHLGKSFAAGVSVGSQYLGGLTYGFDLVNPLTLKFVKDQGAKLVTEVTTTQREAINDLVLRAINEGRSSDLLAQDLKGTVGLRSDQILAAERFQQRLLDQSVPLGKVMDRVQKYRRALLEARGQLIARTEVAFAAAAGQDAVWAASAEAGHIRKEHTKRVWIVTHDDRLDWRICEPLDGAEAELGGLFKDTYLRPPAHPNCRCAVGLKFLEPPDLPAPKPGARKPKPAPKMPLPQIFDPVIGLPESAGGLPIKDPVPVIPLPQHQPNSYLSPDELGKATRKYREWALHNIPEELRDSWYAIIREWTVSSDTRLSFAVQDLVGKKTGSKFVFIPRSAKTFDNVAGSEAASVESFLQAGRETLGWLEYKGLGSEYLLRSLYDVTQRLYRATNTEYVTVYRGYATENKRGVQGQTTKAEMNPLSSWTTNRNVALTFANSNAGGKERYAYVLKAKVPVRQILGDMRQGFGSTSESEVVVIMDRRNPLKAKVDYGWDVATDTEIKKTITTVDDVVEGWPEWTLLEGEVNTYWLHIAMRQ